MNVLVAIAKRRSKRLAGASVHFATELGWWQLILYTIVDNKIAPFGASHFDTQAEAVADANDTLKVTAADWVEVQEEKVEQFILDQAKNRWSPAAYAKRRGLGGPAGAH
jgi:isocitrate dehydrogenase